MKLEPTTRTVRLDRQDAVELLQWAGWPLAHKWADDRLAVKLTEVADVVLPGSRPEDQRLAMALRMVLDGTQGGATFEIVGQQAEAESPEEDTSQTAEAVTAHQGPSDEPAAKEGPSVAKDAEDTGEAATGDSAGAVAAEELLQRTQARIAQLEEELVQMKRSKRKGRSKKGAGAPAKKKPPGPAGVRPGKTRTWCAGQVIKKHGLAAGVTPEMERETDKMYGRPNPEESRAWLNVAWHAINGYVEEFPV